MIKNKDTIKFNIFKNFFSDAKDIFFISVIIISVFLIFNNTQVIILGVSKGLNICCDVIIPSLFPFMVICNFISFSPMVNIMSKIVSPITKLLFRLPVNVGCLIFMSFIGGYPMGAKMISSFLIRDEISINMANRLLCFCVNAGPAFVVTAIGYMMWNSRKIGLYLLISHILGSIIIGILLNIFCKDSSYNLINSKKIKIKTLNYSEAFVKSVVDGMYGILNISSFVIIFSVITELIKCSFSNNRYIHILLSILEITVGMDDIVNFGGLMSLLLCSFFISFSGLSVFCQIFYFLKDYEIDKKKFILFRLIHGFISVVITYLITIFIEDTQYTSVVFCDGNVELFQLTPLISIIIFLLAVFFITFSYSEIFNNDD